MWRLPFEFRSWGFGGTTPSSEGFELGGSNRVGNGTRGLLRSLAGEVVVLGAFLVLGVAASAGVAVYRAGRAVTYESATLETNDGTVVRAEGHEAVERTLRETKNVASMEIVTRPAHDRRAVIVSTAFAFSALLALYAGFRERRKLVAWLRPTWRGIALGILGGLALLFLGWLHDVVGKALGVRFPDVGSLLRQSFDGMSLALLGVVLAPVGEELYFRGRLYDLFCGWKTGRFPLLATAVIFAGFHFLPQLFIAYVVIGVLLGILRLRSGGLVAPIIAHAVNNLAGLFLLP